MKPDEAMELLLVFVEAVNKRDLITLGTACKKAEALLDQPKAAPHQREGRGMSELKPCNNPLCNRRTSLSSLFCCAACGQAFEDHYEIHETGILAHSDGCNQRHAE